MPTTYIQTGLQPFWSYDSFSIASRMLGGGTGYINTAGAKWTITPSGTPKNPATAPTVAVDEGMNFMFSSSDMMLKFFGLSPRISRFYNSTERHHTGNGPTTDSLPRHMGLFGRAWISTYEHCIVHAGGASQSCIEIDPTGARNSWVYSSTSGDIESFIQPKGIAKILTRSISGSYFDLVTPDYTTYRFGQPDPSHPDILPGGGGFYNHLLYIEDKNGVRIYVEWEYKDTGYSSVSRWRIKQISVSTDQGAKKTPFIKFQYTSWHDVANNDAFHLVRSVRDMAGNEIRYGYDKDTETSDIGARLTKVTYPDGASVSYTYTNGWAVGSPTVDDFVMTKVTNPGGVDWEISYSSAHWRVDNSSSSTPDYHTTSYAWTVDTSAYTLPSGFVSGGSGYTAGGTYKTVKCAKTDAESKVWPLYHNCLHGPGNVGNLMRRDDPAGNKWNSFWDDPASDQTIDNLVYLTTTPLYATNADMVQRTEYTTTSNGFKLVSKTYPMYGTTPNFGVKGSVLKPQYSQYTYTTGASTAAKVDNHQDFSTPVYVGPVDSELVTGLNDMTAQGTFSGTSDESFTIIIASTGPDKFNWISNQGGSGTNVSITGSAQALIRGVTVTFAATSGHTVGDTWTFTASAARTDFYSSTAYSYDAKHNLIKTVSATNPSAPPDTRREHVSLDLTTYMEYDNLGNLIRSTDARGNSSSYYYNQFGTLQRSANPLGAVSTQEHDQTGTHLLSSTDPTGATTQYSYDSIGQLVATKDAMGNVSKTQYDLNGNVIGQANAKGYSGKMVHDKKNRLVKTVSPSGVVRELTLSKTGLLQMEKTTYWDSDYSTHEQTIYHRVFYNDAQRVTSRTRPNATDIGTTENDWEVANKTESKYTYDANGSVLTLTDRYGQVTTNTYDTLGRLETTQPPNIPHTTSNEFIRTTYKNIYSGPMDKLSEQQIQEEHSTGGGTSWTVDRSFYFIKKLTYDRAGRTIVIQNPTHTMSGTNYDAYEDTFYNEVGSVTQKQARQVNQTSGAETTWPTYSDYDTANRVVKQSKLVSTDTESHDRQETTFEYDPAGRQTSTNKGGLVIQTSYDKLGRVTGTKQTSSGCGCGGGCKGGGAAAPAAVPAASPASDGSDLWQSITYDDTGNRVTHADASGVFQSTTSDGEGRTIAVSDRAGRVTKYEYWPNGQVKREIRPDGSFIGREYDIEGRPTKVWESIPELNPNQAAGPFGGSKDVALTKTIEYYRGTAMPAGSGESVTWAGTTLSSGAYVSAVRTFTFKSYSAPTTYNYDMVYTSNARGQAEKTLFIDSDDSTTRTTTRLYTCRDQVKRLVNPDASYIDNEYDDHKRLTKTKIDGTNEYNAFDYCLCGPIKTATYNYIDSLGHAQTLDWVFTTDKAGQVVKVYHPYAIAMHGSDEYRSIIYSHDRAGRRVLYSDPTLGHVGADTSGWGSHLEPSDETKWTYDTPQAYRFGMNGAMEATGRVKGREIVAGQGEPYFVKADAANRTSRVLLPDASGTKWRASAAVLRYTGDSNGAPGTLFITGEPSDATEAPKKWQIVTATGGAYGTMALKIDGIAIGGTQPMIAYTGGGATGAITHNGVRMEFVGGRLNEQWTWTHTKSMDRPQLEVQSSRSADGKSAKKSIVDQSGTAWSTAGPEKYVIESEYDNMGRLIRKVSRDSSNDDDSIRWIATYEYDGRGLMVREKILRQDLVAGRMIVTQDKTTKFDLGYNAIEYKEYDEYGLVYTETRTYARGYQITNCTVTSARASGTYQIDVSTSGSYTYDANNNMLTTKSVDVYFHSAPFTRLSYRGQWTFTYDHLNRLKSHINTNTSGVRTNLWCNPMGQVWQRWTDTGGTWAGTLTRYVYDGGMLVQEHSWTANSGTGSWVYAYVRLDRDYLMQPGGIRQKEWDIANSVYVDRFLMTDGGVITTSIDRQTSTTIKRIELASSGDRQAGGSQQDGKLSNLFSPGSYLEGYGGGTSGATGGFDPLMPVAKRYYLPGLGRFSSRSGNNPYIAPVQIVSAIGLMSDPEQSDEPPLYGDENERCARCRDTKDGSHFGNYECWAHPEQLPTNFQCQEELMKCSTCKNGIHCPEDIEQDYGWEPTNSKKWNPQDGGCPWTGGSECSQNYPVSNAIALVKTRLFDLTQPRCIFSLALKNCLHDALYGGLAEAVPIYCDCQMPASGCTECGHGICLNVSQLAGRGGSNEQLRIEYLAAAILHELTHWCLFCKFKRPLISQAIGAASCMKSCFPGRGSGDPGGYQEYGGGFHGWPDQWTEANCGLCGLPTEEIPPYSDKGPIGPPATGPWIIPIGGPFV